MASAFPDVRPATVRVPEMVILAIRLATDCVQTTLLAEQSLLLASPAPVLPLLRPQVVLARALLALLRVYLPRQVVLLATPRLRPAMVPRARLAQLVSLALFCYRSESSTNGHCSVWQLLRFRKCLFVFFIRRRRAWHSRRARPDRWRHCRPRHGRLCSMNRRRHAIVRIGRFIGKVIRCMAQWLEHTLSSKARKIGVEGMVLVLELALSYCSIV